LPHSTKALAALTKLTSLLSGVALSGASTATAALRTAIADCSPIALLTERATLAVASTAEILSLAAAVTTAKLLRRLFTVPSLFVIVIEFPTEAFVFAEIATAFEPLLVIGSAGSRRTAISADRFEIIFLTSIRTLAIITLMTAIAVIALLTATILFATLVAIALSLTHV
jgi:hypothetical protein